MDYIRSTSTPACCRCGQNNPLATKKKYCKLCDNARAAAKRAADPDAARMAERERSKRARIKTFNHVVDLVTGCWNWQGAINEGYGSYAGKPAHRLMYEKLVGPIPANCRVLDHKCHNNLCVNPDHLRPATDQQNVFNSLKRRQPCSSQFKGVYRLKSGRWRASIMHNYKKFNLGEYPTELLAAMVYDFKSIELFGEFAHTNLTVHGVQASYPNTVPDRVQKAA